MNWWWMTVLRNSTGWFIWTWSGLGWLELWVFHCLVNSSWADGKLAEAVWQMEKKVEHPNESVPNPGPWPDESPCISDDIVVYIIEVTVHDMRMWNSPTSCKQSSIQEIDAQSLTSGRHLQWSCSPLGASIYDVRRSVGGGGSPKAGERNKISWFVTVTRGGGG